MRTCTLLTLALAATLTVSAGEKKMMHCFAFTVIETATDAEWKAFGAATDALPSKIPSITKVWHGKLRGTLNLFTPDAESRKKLMAGDPKATGDITRLQRKHGVCMEMDGPDSLKAYAEHPYHKEWMTAYEKVRVAGTTTIDILGQ
ncbi:MAG: hypothetical protein NTV70_16985 [Acidobacteria bacterium]|nr:hypothetical protein [Acidobacteriota bacterium]